MYKYLKYGLMAFVSFAVPAHAQEEEGAFQYGDWQSRGNELSVYTLVNDAENKFGLSCGTGFGGIFAEYQVMIASDDNGILPDSGWESTLQSAEVTAHSKAFGDIVTLMRISSVENGPLGPAVSLEPLARKGDWYDSADGRLIESIKHADRIELRFRGSGPDFVLSFGGRGSSRAIQATRWCDPSSALP